MIPPTPGPDPSSRMFGYATPPDGAGPLGPDQLWPQKVDIPFSQVVSSLNPLQHLPLVGMVYRAVSGDEIPLPMRILGSAVFGGPLGLVGGIFGGLLEELIRLGPDLSRPAAPAGMLATGSEAGVQPVEPGPLPGGAYTTLATVQPEFLMSPFDAPRTAPVMVADGANAAGTSATDAAPATTADGTRAATAYARVQTEWERSQWLEKGIA